jgi:hypothetical protein
MSENLSIYGDVATKSCTLAFKIVYPWSVYKIGTGPDFGLRGDDILAQAEISPRMFEAFSVFLPQDQSIAVAPNHPRKFVAVTF